MLKSTCNIPTKKATTTRQVSHGNMYKPHVLLVLFESELGSIRPWEQIFEQCQTLRQKCIDNIVITNSRKNWGRNKRKQNIRQTDWPGMRKRGNQNEPTPHMHLFASLAVFSAGIYACALAHAQFWGTSSGGSKHSWNGNTSVHPVAPSGGPHPMGNTSHRQHPGGHIQVHTVIGSLMWRPQIF